jgi:hypothetical protein
MSADMHLQSLRRITNMATREEINAAKMQKTFVLPRMMAMGALQNGPTRRFPPTRR